MEMIPYDQLTDAQLTAIAQFNERRHLILRGPRQSGRTTVLQWIIATRPVHYNILVVSLYLDNIKLYYSEMDRKVNLMDAIKFLKLYEDEGRPELVQFDLIIVDGGIIHRHAEFETACVYDDKYLKRGPAVVFGVPNTITFNENSEGEIEHL